VAARRKALVVATYRYADGGLRQLTAPEHDAESFAEVLQDPEIAGFDVTTMVNQPHHVVGEAIADFYADCGRDDLTLLYFSGHGLKDDEGRLYLAMTNTRRQALLFTALSADQLNAAMDACASRRKVLILDCCYSGAFPAGRTAKSDEGVQTLERFQGKGRAVLTASDATQYAFEGDDLTGAGTASVFTRYLVEAIRSGEADLDEDGDIALDELYSYVRDKVVAEVPQQRPKKQEDVDGRILIARNVRWRLPDHLRYAIESPISAQRLGAVQELGHLHQVGNDAVRAAVAGQLALLAADDSRSVSAAATALLEKLAYTPSAGSEVPAPVPAVARPPRAPAPVAVAPAPSPDPGPVAPATAAGPGPAATPSALLVGLLVTAAALLVASRLTVFDSTNGYHAVDLGWSTLSWVLQVPLPVVLAVAVVLAGRPAALALAGGITAGVALSVGSQVLMSLAVFLDPGAGYAAGPAWWLMVIATLVLAIGGVRALWSLRGRTRLRRTWSAATGAGLVVAAAVLWVLTGPLSTDFGWWLYVSVAGLLLSAASLAVAVLDLSPAQRVFGVAAVTTTGTWFGAAIAEALVVNEPGSQPGALFSALVATGLAVGGTWIGQPR